MELLNERFLREVVYGGAVLGAGGGGSIRGGLAAGCKALARGRPRLVHPDELAPESRMVTLSTVSSVAGMASNPVQGHGRALSRLAAADGRPIHGLIASEVGPSAVVYGWRESVLTGIPIVDAPCNGRAHPLGVMGSLGLHRHPEHITTTAAVGKRNDTCVELILNTNVTTASRLVRQAAAQSAIPLAVARNPLPLSYVRKNAAVGGLRYARRLGRVFLENLKGGLARILKELCRQTSGQILAEGQVRSVELAERGGFTIGHILLDLSQRGEALIGVCNEYMILNRNGSPLALFPDLITLFSFESALPIPSNEVRQGQRVSVFHVPRRKLKLGSTMNDLTLLRPIERLLNLRLSYSAKTSAAPASNFPAMEPA